MLSWLSLALSLSVPSPDPIYRRRPLMAIRRRSSVPGERRRRVGEGAEGRKAAEGEEERSGGGGPLSWFFATERRVWGLCLAFRLANALLVQTYFNPDEHWQALEVAHRIAFGYGHLTWEWKEGIRSYAHPMVFVSLYKVLAFLDLDTPLFMMKAPRLLQSTFASLGDLYIYKLSCVMFDKHVAQWALFSQLTCWFMFFCVTRTLSNSLEAVLTSVSLFYWLSYKASFRGVQAGSRRLALSIAALACIIRPTSAITWIYIGIWEFLQTSDRTKFLFLEVLPIGILVLLLSCLLDWWMYGSLIFVPFNFFKFNLLSSGGDYYGTHKWHWYFSQGFPVMLFTFLPFSSIGIFHSKEWRLSGLIAWVLGVYSILGHKEFRFVLPVLPVALIFSGYFLANLSGHGSYGLKQKRSFFYIRCPSRKYLVLFLIGTNVPMALYMSLVHQRGSEDVMKFLAYEAHDGKVRDILFLTPCHATPYYSTLHYNLPMHFLDCSPSHEKGVLDESDQFMKNPQGFVSDRIANWSLPSHIVLFDSEERQLRDFLISHSFTEVRRFFHAHFKVDRDLQASVAVYASTGK